MRCTCISDTHGHYPELPGGDLLIVAGDLTGRDLPKEYITFNEWLFTLEYRKIVVVGGNHDNVLSSGEYKNYEIFNGGNGIDYLCDSGTEFQNLKIWGSPWTRSFKGMNKKCKAFTCHTEEQLGEKFALIPDDTDILITHSPPWTILDRTIECEQVGSAALLAHHIKRLRPNLQWLSVEGGRVKACTRCIKTLAKN